MEHGKINEEVPIMSLIDNGRYTYECIDINKQSEVRINITKQIIKLLNDKKPQYTEKVIAPSQYSDPLREIFKND